MCDNFTKTTFITVPIPATLSQGKPVGEGKCKAVRLKLNAHLRNSVTPVVNGGQPYFIYYGDAQSQENELQAQTVSRNGLYDWSPIIYCTDLNQVYVRYSGQIENSWPLEANVQVQIYQ